MTPLLRDRIGIYDVSDTSDGQGGQARTWNLQLTVWAGVEPLGLITQADTGRTLRRYRVTLRHRTDIPSPARIFWRGQTLAVRTHSDPDLRRERLHLICEEL